VRNHPGSRHRRSMVFNEQAQRIEDSPSVKRRLPDTQFATVRFFDLGFFLELRIFRSELHYLGVEVGTSSLSRQAWQDTACRMT
jgi:hypothetical protein